MTTCPICKTHYLATLHPHGCPHCAAIARGESGYVPPRQTDDSGPGFMTGMIVGSLLGDSGGGTGIPYAAADPVPEPFTGGGGEFSGGGAGGSWDDSSSSSSSSDSSSSDSGSSSSDFGSSDSGGGSSSSD